MSYVEVNGTSYDNRTPVDLINILECHRIERNRLRFVFGDPASGTSWQETNYVSGRIGRSTGQVKIPLLVHNARSLGGAGLLTHCIIGVRYSRKVNGEHVWIWRNPLYKGDE